MTLRLTAEQVRSLGYALDRMTSIRKELGVEIGVHAPAAIGWDAQYLDTRWDTEAEQYVIDDFNR